MTGPPARAYIDGEYLGEVTSLEYTVIVEPIRFNRPSTPEGAELPFEFTQTFVEPPPSLWTRFWCATWWGHRPRRRTMWDLARDTYTCNCGKVTETAEHMIEWPNPWFRDPLAPRIK